MPNVLTCTCAWSGPTDLPLRRLGRNPRCPEHGDDRRQELAEAQDGVEIFMVLDVLRKVQLHNAIGACLAFLVDCAYNSRAVFSRCMREPIHKDGLVGISFLEVFRRQSQ